MSEKKTANERKTLEIFCPERVVSIRLPGDLIDALKSRARLEAVERDEDYSYANLIKDVLYKEARKTESKNAK